MKKRNVIFYILWLVVLVIIQPTLMQGIEVFGVSPDLFLVLVVCAGLFRGKGEGAVAGFIFGLAFDVMVGRLVGLSGIIYMYAGFSAGMVRERVVSDRITVAIPVILATALLGGVIYYIGYHISYGDLGFGIALIRTILPKALYTTVAGIVLFVPIRKSFDLIREKMF